MIRSRSPRYGHRPVSRRGVLLGGLAVLVGAGGGIAAGVVRPLHPHHSGKPAPADLIDALASERVLISRLESTLGQDPGLRAVYAVLHADHVAHATALEAALRKYRPAASPVLPAPGRSPGKQQQRAAETTNAAAAAKRAARLSGTDATLLASIAACEASHVEVLR
jgi:hypothetical protein